MLAGSAHDHDGVVQRPLSFVHELLGAASDDDGAGFGFGAAGEEVEALTADLFFLEQAAGSENFITEIVSGRLDGASAGFHSPGHISGLDAAGAEDAAVGEILRGHVTNWQLRKDDFGSRLNDVVQLLVQDVPLG